MFTQKRRITKEYVPVYVDIDTGEIVNDLSPQEKQKADANADTQFFKGYPQLIEIAKLWKVLSKTAFALFIYISVNMSYNNKFFYNCKKFSKDLDLTSSTTSKSFKELLEYNIITQVNEDKLYLANPRYTFRGRDSLATKNWFNKLVNNQSSQFSSESEESKTEQELRFSKLEGLNKKAQIIEYLLKCKDTANNVYKQIQEIMEETKISKSTIIPFLRTLQSDGYISRPARGHIKLLRVNDLKRLLR